MNNRNLDFKLMSTMMSSKVMKLQSGSAVLCSGVSRDCFAVCRVADEVPQGGTGRAAREGKAERLGSFRIQLEWLNH